MAPRATKGTAMIGLDGVLRLEGWLASGCRTSDRLDEPALQAEARALVPLATLRERRDACAHEGDDESDGLLRQLLAWFKFEFFAWVSQPVCGGCGGATRSAGSAAPSADDLARGAARVELYACAACGARTRFPRYNDARTLLATRRGRCGEWAHAFTLLCRALGLHARYVHDVTDHVWTEVWSAARARWLHCDPCENKLDAPLLYSAGWGKALSFVLAFGPGEALDVTRRYVDSSRSAALLASRAGTVSESFLAARLRLLDVQRRAALPPDEVCARDARRQPDDLELSAPAARAAPTEAEAVGRQTGSVEWRAARGELGGARAPPAAEPAHEWLVRPCAPAAGAGGAGEWRLRYSTARDVYVEGGLDALPALRGWRAGAACARNVKRALEDDWHMAYLARGGAAEGSLEWAFRADAGLRIVGGAALLSHSLHAEGAAVRWRLSRDGGDSWRTLAAPKDAPVQLARALAAVDARGMPSASEPRDGCAALRLRAELVGGSWQSAQLFRQSRADLSGCPFDLRLLLAPDAPADAAPARQPAGAGGEAGLRERFSRLLASVSAEERFREDPTGAAAEAVRRMRAQP